MFVVNLNKTIKSLRTWLLIIVLSGCASSAQKPENVTAPKPLPQTSQQTVKPAVKPEFTVVGSYQANAVSGDYAGYPALNQFIEQMAQKYGFEREYLYGLFSKAKRKQWTLDYLHNSDLALKTKPAKGGWTRYRSQFLDAKHINAGVKFWRNHQPALQRASQQYGVPPEYILGIIAVETSFGGNVGNHKVLDALTTLSFDYQRRGEYFKSELENFLVMSGQEAIDPVVPVGSFAGAMGLGQFMPSSFLQWAVDFNGDGRKDLWNPEDVIGSVANYFAQHGWQKGQPVVSSANMSSATVDPLEPGIDNQYSLNQLKQAGISPMQKCVCDYSLRLLLLRHQTHDEYLLGHPNFYVISRYNHSTYYSMAVHELAQAIKTAYSG